MEATTEEKVKAFDRMALAYAVYKKRREKIISDFKSRDRSEFTPGMFTNAIQHEEDVVVSELFKVLEKHQP